MDGECGSAKSLSLATRQRESMSRIRLAILPGLTHDDIFMSPQLPATVVPFLDGKVSTINGAK